MPFLQAGFNRATRDTGIRAGTRHIDGKRYVISELRQFLPSAGDRGGDYCWKGERPGKGMFFTWGEQVVIGTWEGFDVPGDWPKSEIKNREGVERPVKLVLPYPVSANRYWISFWAKNLRRVITGVTKEAEAFKEECEWRARAAGVRVPLTGPVELRVRLVPENKVCMDLDNALKVTVDAMKGIVYADDDQIYRIVAERGNADPTGKHVEIEVLPYQIPMPLEAAA